MIENSIVLEGKDLNLLIQMGLEKLNKREDQVEIDVLEKGRTIAATQYAAGADVIYQAAGGTGAGVFKEAKDLNEKKNEDEKVWVLGVDRDQKAEGNYKSKDGKNANFVLASTLKKVGQVVKTVSDDAANNKFEGGKHVAYGIKDGSVDLINDNMSDNAVKAVEAARQAIKSGEVKVPEQ